MYLVLVRLKSFYFLVCNFFKVRGKDKSWELGFGRCEIVIGNYGKVKLL